MGRMQSFERTTVVQAARDLFWDRGFEGASLAELEGATGLKRSSLYHAFGSKRGLFDAAVEDYQDSVIRPRLRILTEVGAGRAALIAYFEELRSAVSALPEDSPRRGCLLVNCAAGLAGHDGQARQVVDGYRSELTRSLQNALRAAAEEPKEPGERDLAAAPVAERARTLAALGMSAMVIARVNAAESVALLDTALAQIGIWFPDPADAQSLPRSPA